MFFNDLHTCTFYTNLNRAHAHDIQYTVLHRIFTLILYLTISPITLTISPITKPKRPYRHVAVHVFETHSDVHAHMAALTDKHGHAAASKPTHPYVLNERLQV